MKILIIGGYGFLGKKLALEILRKKNLKDINGEVADTLELILVSKEIADAPIEGVISIKGDISDKNFIESIINEEIDSIFHLAAVVSRQAEEDFTLGMKVNVDATRLILDRCRELNKKIKVIFTSSIAVFGNSDGNQITDDSVARPLSSYGMEKVLAEYLLVDYIRRGYIEGCCLRLPTIIVRPGKPNQAASSFASSIIREPLSGIATICPVNEQLSLWLQSPETAIKNLIHGHNLTSNQWHNHYRVLNLSGLTVTVGEIIKGLINAGGDASLLTWQEDKKIIDIVSSWPDSIEANNAKTLGFFSDSSIDEIIGNYKRSIAK